MRLSKERKSHWEQVYANKSPTEVSWYQPVPEDSLEFIESTGIDHSDAIIDAGGGASTLVDNLVNTGYSDITVLDISRAALERTRERLGERAGKVSWIESDVTEFEPERQYMLWHDRAVFHFLTDAGDRRLYRNVVISALRPGGHLVMATFGPEGPLKCSGLEICRYDAEQLQREIGSDFTLRSHTIERHQTPGGSSQQFLFAWFQFAN